MTTNRIAYDTNVSAQVQSDIQALAAHLENLIAARQADVNQAMADFRADGVDTEYQAVETRWTSAADEVKAIIALVRTTLGTNDETATTAATSARNAVQSIG
ncbi:pore-forming ESAT-6 family protein [Arthrobacter sp. 31Y]|uniref:pore-forming ESAT-6 family protein n=1 Tax=Arthrobacter sp. 31Y TaxID=1115632 RepID=UPI0004673644|nr:pore-forming ESAT-6 family protein [Arthrobacter sp. 31Y]